MPDSHHRIKCRVIQGAGLRTKDEDRRTKDVSCGDGVGRGSDSVRYMAKTYIEVG